MNNQGDVLSLMQKLQALTDRYKVSDLLDLFNDDAQFQIMDHSTLIGKETIRQAFEHIQKQHLDTFNSLGNVFHLYNFPCSDQFMDGLRLLQKLLNL